jgi:hypothetical protein
MRGFVESTGAASGWEKSPLALPFDWAQGVLFQRGELVPVEAEENNSGQQPARQRPIAKWTVMSYGAEDRFGKKIFG